MAQARLSKEVKTFIVQQLACFDGPSRVVKLVKAEHGVEVSRQQIENYDPTKRQGRDLSEGLRAIFDATHAAFLDRAETIGITHRAVRLRALERMARKAEEMKNLPLVANLLEQAAKEMSGAYTRRHQRRPAA